MSAALQFETPENVELAIHPAGLGTRFYAWFVDSVLTMLVFLIVIVLTIIGLASLDVAQVESVRRWLREFGADQPNEAIQGVAFVIVGVVLLLWGLSGFLYFGLFELLMRGQTPGKRTARIRVVKSNGFSLDAASILVRNIFRVVDHLPVLWLVPLLSAKSQRLGDMVAGTLVVQEAHESLSPIRMTLSQRTTAESKFTFPAAKLKLLRPQDLHAVETLLERWPKLTAELRHQLLSQLLPALIKRLEVSSPGPDEELVFLSDLLAAQFRWEGRRLG